VRRLMLDGVISKYETVTIDSQVSIGRDTVVEPFARSWPDRDGKTAHRHSLDCCRLGLETASGASVHHDRLFAAGRRRQAGLRPAKAGKSGADTRGQLGTERAWAREANQGIWETPSSERRQYRAGVTCNCNPVWAATGGARGNRLGYVAAGSVNRKCPKTRWRGARSNEQAGWAKRPQYPCRLRRAPGYTGGSDYFIPLLPPFLAAMFGDLSVTRTPAPVAEKKPCRNVDNAPQRGRHRRPQPNRSWSGPHQRILALDRDNFAARLRPGGASREARCWCSSSVFGERVQVPDHQLERRQA
jgi:hypothetical protein